MVDDGGRPAGVAGARAPGPRVEPFENLPDRQPFVDEPAVEHPHDRRFGVLDNQMAGARLLPWDVPVPIGGDVRDILPSAGLVQLAPAKAFAEHGALVLRDGGLDLEEQLNPLSAGSQAG
jgi:hypothetical protein